MGAWGTGPFDNDDATGFASSLDDLEPDGKVEAIREALAEAAGETDYLERDAGDIAVAAAALVAAQAPDGDPVDGEYGPTDDIPELPEELRPLAVQALTRVVADDSALNELWSDSPNGETWFAMVAQLTEVLTAS